MNVYLKIGLGIAAGMLAGTAVITSLGGFNSKENENSKVDLQKVRQSYGQTGNSLDQMLSVISAIMGLGSSSDRVDVSRTDFLYGGGWE